MKELEHDLKRILSNQRNLLDVMPEMMLLVNGSLAIEYMNPKAHEFFQDEKKKAAPPSRKQECLTPETFLPYVAQTIEKNLVGIIQTITREDRQFEYALAPFLGYRGENLFWLFLRDTTEHHKHIEELSQFHNSIESILSYKIRELKESERVRKCLLQELNTLKDHLKKQPEEGMMVGSSKALTELRDMVFQVAKSDATILITGESGTGKELVANLIRETSGRNEKPFLKINCNTINDSLLESDLFGYEKGAFTGADARRKGKFEAVDGGTIFLDEIGDVSPRMQAALLRVLQENEIIRVGGTEPIRVDVRIIAATNRDLAAAVQNGTFRLDLYYRLNIINILIPPLRQRKDDIMDLVTYFIRKYRRIYKKEITFLPQSLVNRLLGHDWPGNVRELENVIQRAVLMAKSNTITENELIFDFPPTTEIRNGNNEPFLQRFTGMSLKGMVAEIEKEIIAYSLERNKGNVALTADELNIGKTAFYDKMKRYDISAKELR